MSYYIKANPTGKYICNLSIASDPKQYILTASSIHLWINIPLWSLVIVYKELLTEATGSNV